MRIISKRTLVQFYDAHPEAEQSLKRWYKLAKMADWKTPTDVKTDIGNASIIGNNRIVFNISGNKYRLIAAANYKHRMLYIRFIGTHKEYDKINAEII
jgi:mRNA interferase HigB